MKILNEKLKYIKNDQREKQSGNQSYFCNEQNTVRAMCKIYNKFPLAPMGVLAPGSPHARPSARPPIDTSGKFPAHMSAESPSNISPNPSEVISEVSEP